MIPKPDLSRGVIPSASKGSTLEAESPVTTFSRLRNKAAEARGVDGSHFSSQTSLSSFPFLVFESHAPWPCSRNYFPAQEGEDMIFEVCFLFLMHVCNHCYFLSSLNGPQTQACVS